MSWAKQFFKALAESYAQGPYPNICWPAVHSAGTKAH